MEDWTKTRPDSWRTMREHFCFLPLQISHFDELGRVAAYLHPSGLEDQRATDPNGPARMTPKGDILVATEEFSAVGRTLRKELDLNEAIEIRRRHQQRISQLQACEQQAAVATATSWNDDSWRCAWSSTAQAIAELAPYGLVSKILPDLILEWIGGVFPERLRAGRRPQGGSDTFPQYLGSNKLARDMQYLARRLQAFDVDEAHPQRTARRDAELERFCQDHIGLGPRAWEAPGYENPRYVSGAVRRAQPPTTGADTANLGNLRETSVGASGSPAPARSTAPSTTWEDELEYWSSQLDTQTSVMRWGFLKVELPLLREITHHWISTKVIRTPSDLLYCTRHEIGNSPPYHEEIERRRYEYQMLTTHAGRSELTHAPEALMDSPSSTPPSLSSQQRGTTAKPSQLSGAAPHTEFRGQSVSTPDLRSGAAWLMGPTISSLPSGPEAVVIARHLTPELTPALLGAAAVVVEEGGSLQHAAIVAREIGIPCVVGCRGLLERVTPGMFVTVDGRDGRVTVSAKEGS